MAAEAQPSAWSAEEHSALPLSLIHISILDGLAFSVDLLRHQPQTYRRAILLLSETIDHGSHTSLDQALRAVEDTNTIIYSVGFSLSLIHI